MKPFILAFVLSIALGGVVVLSGQDLPRADYEIIHLADDAVALAQ